MSRLVETFKVFTVFKFQKPACAVKRFFMNLFFFVLSLRLLARNLQDTSSSIAFPKKICPRGS